MSTTLARTADRYFYTLMSCVIVTIVVYGFSRTIGRSLLHPAAPPPAILYLHVAVFSGWLLLLLTQTLLARTGRVRVHRRLGYAGLVLGVLIPVVGIATKIVILHRSPRADDAEYAFAAVTINDLLCFSVAFTLAMLWRRKPEYHRRLIYLASCCLTVAAFARFPPSLVLAPWWYAYVDALIVAAMLRDWAGAGRVHVVYLAGLPALIAAQLLAMSLFLTAPRPWVQAMRTLLG